MRLSQPALRRCTGSDSRGGEGTWAVRELDTWGMRMFAAADDLRRMQAEFLEYLGLGPDECRYRIIAAGIHWRLRAYGEAAGDLPVLIVSAPIKPPYLWDISPAASTVRYGLAHGLRIYLIEWVPPHAEGGNYGLDQYIQAIGDAITRVANDGRGRPFLMGHSLGGTLAAMLAALEPDSLRGLVLLGAPLCFRPGTSCFGDVLASVLPSGLSQHVMVPGSLISQLSAWVSPGTFIWSRAADAVLSIGNREAADLHARVERWSLDEVPVPGQLIGQIGQWLYREDRFCREALVLRNRAIGPSRLRTPTLGVLNTSDSIAAPESMAHFLSAVPGQRADTIGYPGELGTCFQHVALLVGPEARSLLWPKIVSWLTSVATAAAG